MIEKRQHVACTCFTQLQLWRIWQRIGCLTMWHECLTMWRESFWTAFSFDCDILAWQIKWRVTVAVASVILVCQSKTSQSWCYNLNTIHRNLAFSLVVYCYQKLMITIITTIFNFVPKGQHNFLPCLQRLHSFKTTWW